MPAADERVEYGDSNPNALLAILTAKAAALTMECADAWRKQNDLKVAIMGTTGTTAEKEALLASHSDGGVESGAQNVADFNTLTGSVTTTMTDATFLGYVRRLWKGPQAD